MGGLAGLQCWQCMALKRLWHIGSLTSSNPFLTLQLQNILLTKVKIIYICLNIIENYKLLGGAPLQASRANPQPPLTIRHHHSHSIELKRSH